MSAGDASLPAWRCLREWPAPLPPSLQPRLVHWMHSWDAAVLAAEVRLESSGRMRSSLGRAYLEQRLVRINRRLAAPGLERLLEEVLCHELAHLVVFERHGSRARPHGREWRSLLREVDSPVRVTIPRDECSFLPPVRRRRRRRSRRAPMFHPGTAMLQRMLPAALWTALTRFHGRLM